MKNKHSRIWAAVFMSILIAVSTVLTAVGHIDKAQAAEKAVLQVSTVSGHRGDEVSVTVSLTSNPGIAGLVFSLTFDNKVLKLVDVKEPANTDDEFIFYEPIIKNDAINDTSINYIGYAFASGKSNITKTGIVYTATFKILDEAAIGTTQLNIAGRNGQDTADVSNIDEKAVPIEVTAGSVTVTCEHKHTETVKTAATCTKDGLEVVTCKDCKEVISSTVLKSTGHKYGDWIVDKAVTCTEDGEEYRECSVCHNKITQKIEHKGHVAGTPEVTKEPTCTKEGTRITKCTVCSEVLKTETLAKKEHSWGEWKTTVEPTCQKDGKKESVCSVCGETKSEVIPKSEEYHKYTDYTVTKQATCKEEGTLTAYCTICHNLITKSIPKTDKHVAGTPTVEKEATCTKAGKKVTRCTVCGVVLEEEVIEATGHTYDDGVVTKKATCTEAGVKIYTCTKCHDTKTEAIEALGHDYGEAKITTEPTCTKDGVKSYICKRCGDVKTEVLPAIGHTYDEGKITKEPTETEEGMLVRTCTRCGETETIALPKLDKSKVKLETSEGSEFTGVITAGKDNNVILSVIGMNYAVPNGGDVRYVPVRWSFAAANQEIKWNNITDSNYSISLNSAEAGDYKLVVEYKREMYKTLADGTKGWVASDSALAASTYVAETTLKVEEKQSSDDTKEDVKPEDTTKDDNNNNDSEVTEGVKTGDMSVNIAVLMMMLMLMSGTAVIYTGKSGKAR
ncbi:MAG: cohesin domain-containing protein [Lachnospira sp.]|nr:cohesin domain-containing protein [Lachnospira sp.]